MLIPKSWLFVVMLVSILVSWHFIGFPGPTLQVNANPVDSHLIYLPLVVKNYKNPPTPTVSHYISWSSADLNCTTFYNMGKGLGESVESDFSGYVILQFGEPWSDGQQYGVQDYSYPHTFIPVSDIDGYVECYLSGYYHNSPSDSHLVVVAGITNQGPHIGQGFGQAWGQMITNVVDWIESPPDYSAKIGVAGGIDNELRWNEASDSLNWKYGYSLTTSRYFIYYGDCDSCPFEDEPDWTPEPYGWTLEQIYDMASGYWSFALPQIYRKDNQHAEQWYALSLYMYLQYYEPSGFMGSLTQLSACQENGGCSSGNPDAIDNAPDEGWLQLWGEISSDPRTSQSRHGIPFELSLSTDISWNHWKVSVTR